MAYDRREAASLEQMTPEEHITHAAHLGSGSPDRYTAVMIHLLFAIAKALTPNE